MKESKNIESDEFSAFIQKIHFELEMLEKDFLNLEKEYFLITPYFDKIFQRLDKIRNQAEENEASVLKHRVSNLSHEVLRFHHNSGYNVEAFHHLFKSLKIIRSKLTDEVFSESALQIIREKVRKEASRWIPEGLPRGSDLHKYLAVQNFDMNFLIPFKKKIWEKRVENKKKLRIQIKSIKGENIFSFKSLPAAGEPSHIREKTGVLLESEDGEKFGILTDCIEGVMVFSKKFMKKHTDYFPVGAGNFKPYVTLKGKRYFIRNSDD